MQVHVGWFEAGLLTITPRFSWISDGLTWPTSPCAYENLCILPPVTLIGGGLAQALSDFLARVWEKVPNTLGGAVPTIEKSASIIGIVVCGSHIYIRPSRGIL